MSETVPRLVLGHSPCGDRGSGYGHPPSGGALRPPPYCGKYQVTDQGNAVLSAVFLCADPEESPLSVRAGGLNPCGICCQSSTCEDSFPPSLSDEG